MASFDTVATAWRAISDAAARFGQGSVVPLRRFLHLYRQRRFSPREIYFNDLLNPVVSDGALENYASREELIALDQRYALPAYLCLAADKAVFYSVCATAGLPAPTLHAVFDRPSGWTPAGQLLTTDAEWHALLQSIEGEFIVKPALGLQGRGVTALRRDGDGFVDHLGQRYSAATLHQLLLGQSEQNLFTTSYAHHSLAVRSGSHKSIVQQRVFAHAAIAGLIGSSGLCTCRLPTVSRPDQPAEIIGSAIRLISGNNIIDNRGQSTDGNLWCSVDTATGQITEAFLSPDGGRTLRRVEDHPTTGRRIVGFQIPCWEAACALALRAAEVFRPQGLITWDIGIGTDGPVVIEGNVGGDMLPSPMNRPIRTLLERGSR